MFATHVTQTNHGCDFDFLETRQDEKIGEPDIF